MSQSLVQNYIHIIFSTKNRTQLILPQYEDELYSYLGSICNKFECSPIKIGGYNNHVHLLCKLSKNITLVNLLRELKSNSSKWMKTKDDSLKEFYWQDGYGVFSVSSSGLEAVREYISSQHQHHQRLTYQDEYMAFLKKYNVDFDERYVWD